MKAFLFHLLTAQGYWIAGLITVITFVLLPRGERRRGLIGPILLIVSGMCAILWRAADEPASELRLFEYLALLLLLSAIGRSLFLLLFHIRPVRAVFQQVPQILLDFVQLLIFAVALLLTLHASGISAGSLVASSALIAALVGIVAKDSLGNVFAGLSLHSDRPFAVGDWIQFDNDKSRIGKVLKVNWRSTRLLTLDESQVVVPNSVLAQSPLVVFTQPTPVARRSVYFAAPMSVAPQEVHRIVLDAIAEMQHIVHDPPPTIVTSDFDGRGVVYWLRFFTTEFQLRDRIDGEARDRIWYAFQRNGIPLSTGQYHLRVDRVNLRTADERRARRLAARCEALRGVDFLHHLPETSIGLLAARVRRRLFATGERLIREGGDGSELFVLTSGAVRVSKRATDGSDVEINRLSPPAFFGEMSLLTGQQRSATVTALAPTHCFVIDKEALAPLLLESPNLVTLISQTIKGRSAERDTVMDHHVPVSDGEAPGTLLDQITDFFGL